MYGKILLPVDGSDVSEKVFNYVLSLMDDDTEIILLHVINNAYISNFSEEELLKDLSIPRDEILGSISKVVRSQSDEILDKLKDDLETLLNDNNMNNKIEILNAEGNVSHTILEVADEDDIDLIVMASTGKTGLDRFLLGSVTEKVLYHTKVPIIIVP